MSNFTSEVNEFTIPRDTLLTTIEYVRLLILSVGTIGNMLAMIIMTNQRSIRKTSFYILLMNQCFLNIICTLYSLYLSLSRIIYLTKIRKMSGNWDLFLCTIFKSHVLTLIASCSSNYNLAASSFERSMSIIYPIYHRNIFTDTNIRRLCVFIWILGCIVMLPHAFLLNDISPNGFCYYWTRSTNTSTLIFTCSLHISYLGIPLFITIVSFAGLYKMIAIRKIKAKLNIIKMLFSCSVLYLLLQGQRICITFINIYYGRYVPHAVSSMSVMFLTVCFAINPIVYVIQYKDYRLELYRIFVKLLGCRRRVSNVNFNSNSVNPSTINISDGVSFN